MKERIKNEPVPGGGSVLITTIKLDFPPKDWVVFDIMSTRRALSQFWSVKIRRTTFLNYIKFVDPRILGL